MKKIFFKINSINSKFVNYGFFTRNGGYSKKNFKSLNCSYSSNDNKRYVNKNILTAINKLKLDNKKLILVKQNHSTKIININSKNYNKKHSADGIITNAKLAQDIISAETELTATPASTDEILISDAGTLKRADVSQLSDQVFKQNTFAATLTSFSPGTVTHNLGTYDVIVQCMDASSYETIKVSVDRTSTDVVTISGNSFPGGDIRVMITAIQS